MEVIESKYRLARELKRKMKCSCGMINILYEYFQYNMDNLDGFYPEYDEITRSRTYILYGQEYPHYLNQEEANGEFHYYPSEPVFISDAVSSEQEIVCFSLEVLRSDLLLRKDYICRNLAIAEKYDCSNGMIVARIYDSESLMEQSQSIQGSITTGTRSFIDYLIRKDAISSKEIISVCKSKNSADDEYVIEDHVAGEEVPTKIVVNGSSLYSAYYKYMTEKGYLDSSDDQKGNGTMKALVGGC